MSILAGVLWLGLAGCGGGGGGDGLPADGPGQADEAGEMAKQIAADPAKRAEVLAAHGVDEATFERALYDIAADAELTGRYEAARAR